MEKNRRKTLGVCLGALLMLSVSSPGIGIRTKNLRRTQLSSQTTEQASQKQARISLSFEPARALLRDKNVPFDPEVLLDREWPRKLELVFAQMPEMQQVRYLDEPLKGVQLADTLYLPERVDVVEDTVILARHLVFEGSEVVIKGSHHISIFPAQDIGVLGTTLRRHSRTASEKQQGQSGIEIPETRPPTRDGHITIDTSGIGSKEWVESIGGENRLYKLVRALYNRDKRVRDEANREFEALRHETVRKQRGVTLQDDTSGSPGAMGATGDSGRPPDQASPPVQPKAAGGTCGGDINGAKGSDGAAGGWAGDAGTGRTGGKGGNGTGGSYYIPDGASGPFSFISHGGEGGVGGPGGYAYPGAQGGTGGEGGDGATCNCQQGGAGTGGKGGAGGPGGRGGAGGDGGQGGAGGTGGEITVSLPCHWTGNYTYDVYKGGVGIGQTGSVAGASGGAGNPGAGGHPGTNFYCSSSGGQWGNSGVS
jgi:hypothetical protein